MGQICLHYFHNRCATEKLSTSKIFENLIDPFGEVTNRFCNANYFTNLIYIYIYIQVFRI